MLELCSQLRFLPGSSNVLPDFLSRHRELFGDARRKDKDEGVVGLDTRCRVGLSQPLWKDVHFGHVGLESMLARCAEWKLAVNRQWLYQKLDKCMHCLRFANVRITEQFEHLPPVTEPGERLRCDLIGPIDRLYICRIVDHLTRLMQAEVLPRATTNLVIQCLDHWLSSKRQVGSLLLDNASYFIGNKLKAWAKEHAIKLLYIPNYQHRAGGLVERANRNLLERIHGMKDSQPRLPWTHFVSKAAEACNLMWNRSTI